LRSSSLPQDQALPDRLVDVEQPQLLAQHTVIALPRFFQALEVFLQV
jgi:hypothetical protein